MRVHVCFLCLALFVYVFVCGEPEELDEDVVDTGDAVAEAQDQEADHWVLDDYV